MQKKLRIRANEWWKVSKRLDMNCGSSSTIHCVLRRDKLCMRFFRIGASTPEEILRNFTLFSQQSPPQISPPHLPPAPETVPVRSTPVPSKPACRVSLQHRCGSKAHRTPAVQHPQSRWPAPAGQKVEQTAPRCRHVLSAPGNPQP